MTPDTRHPTRTPGTSARRDLARALAGDDAAPLAAWLDTHRIDHDDLVWLHRQGLIMFGFYRFEQAALLDRLPADVASQWQDIAQQTTVTTATLDWEIERVLAALIAAQVDFIWLKGAALAYTVYPTPLCRGRGDLDLWIPVEQLPLAVATLTRLGYRGRSKDDRPDALALLVGGEQQLAGVSPGLDLIELQWPAIRGEWVRHTAAVDHAGIWRRRVPLALAEQTVSLMAPEDALIHLCFHQAINHQFSMPWLRNLLDVHLLNSTYRLDWGQITSRAVEWRLATVVWTVLSLARRMMGSDVPDSCLDALAPSRWRRELIAALHLEEDLVAMSPGGYGYRRFAIQMAMVDRLRDGLCLVWRGLFPTGNWLAARYAGDPHRPLWRLRITHIWRLATTARA